MARTVAAEAELALDADRAAELWTDPSRWASFIEGFAHVVERDDSWPAEGSKLVWESNPQGRGRVTEKISARSPGVITSQIYEDRLTGVQTARFADGRFSVRLDYELAGGGPLAAVTDVLFIRRALRDMLRRTVRRFSVEAEEEAALR